MNAHSFKMQTLNGKEIDLASYKGKVILAVNVASNCRFTYQYKGLEDLYQKYKDKGLVVLGFPCNQFNQQESGTEAEIESFCQVNYGVTFPMSEKVEVNGPKTLPLFRYLKRAKPGLLWSEAIKWNFTKFLIDKNGHAMERFAPTSTPESLEKTIEAALNQ